MPRANTILIVEDEEPLRDLLAQSLRRQGYTVLVAAQGAQALHLLALHAVDLILLDIRLPQMDGLAVCQAVRQRSGIPIVILSGLSRPRDVVHGLALGADEYITKPFRFHELIARIHAVLRRAAVGRGQLGFPWLARGDVVLNLQAPRVWMDQHEIRLTPLEGRLLHYLMVHAERAVPTATLLRDVWEYAESENGAIVHNAVQRLRAKIEPDPRSPQYIVSVWGLGYKFQMRSPVEKPT
jgi:DNA-binding response OmpR family regulator